MGNQAGGAPVTELSEFEQRIVANVKKHGCQVNHVFDPDQVTENFSYSIGFRKTVRQPEVIVFGLPKGLMHSMINEVLSQCFNGLNMADGMVVSNLIEGFDCVVKNVLDSNITHEHFGSAIWFDKHVGGGGVIDAFQIVWPGANDGLFPWEEGAAEDVIHAQPALYELAA